MAKNNNINLDDLSVIIKNEFDKVQGEFDKTNQKIDDLKRSLDEVKLKFAYVAWAIDYEELKRRVVKLEKKIKP